MINTIPEKRAGGILLHITSLPSEYGIGDLGPGSHRFAEILSEIGQQYWSILPLTPTGEQYDNSPYQPDSSFAGNTLLISPDLLVDDGLLSRDYVDTHLILPEGRVDYSAVVERKERMMHEAYSGFKGADRNEFEEFCASNSGWLEDYALFRALRRRSGKPWYDWPKQLRDKERTEGFSKDCSGLLDLERFSQFIFYRQWHAFKGRCSEVGVRIVGDLPFYMGYDSADVWSHPELFKLDPSKRPRFVGGVPPDYFSSRGQLWGNPVYDWRRMEREGFEWWRRRIRHNLMMYDMLRLDHFRGYVAYWEVRSGAADARRGRWIKAPAEGLFRVVSTEFPSLPFVAEDLGVITEDVKESMRRLGIPGMRVLLFAFNGSPDNPHLPENHPRNAVAMTGTHDTNTVRGWFTEEATADQREELFQRIDRRVSEREISAEFIKMAMSSEAGLRIIPLQDVLSLGSEARMNHPARIGGNWRWRASREQLEEIRMMEDLRI